MMEINALDEPFLPFPKFQFKLFDLIQYRAWMMKMNALVKPFFSQIVDSNYLILFAAKPGWWKLIG